MKMSSGANDEREWVRENQRRIWREKERETGREYMEKGDEEWQRV